MTGAPDFALIATPEALAAAARRWRGADEIALDTEFVFERTYRPRPGLVQLACDGEVALLDVVALADLSPVAEIFSAAGIRKSVHAGSADVDIVRRLAGVTPTPLFDTQVAAAFAGLGTGLSYAAVVQATQGVALAKSETRTDWTRRPLAPAQLAYAAEDVSHLLPAARILRDRLAELGRLAWAEEESRTLLSDSGDEVAEPWRRIRGLDGLPPHPRAVARALAIWREREAERLDLARPFLLRDETLVALARRREIARDELPQLPGWEARRHLPHAEAWLAAHAVALREADAADLPPPEPRRSRAQRERDEKRSRALAGAVARVAGGLELPAELLLSRRLRQRLLAAIDRGEAPAEHLTGFRRELLAEPLGRLDLEEK